MLGAALLLGLFFFGASLVLDGTGGVQTLIGWGSMVLPVIRWRIILNGLRRAGGVAAVVIVIAALAAGISGEWWLWSQLF